MNKSALEESITLPVTGIKLVVHMATRLMSLQRAALTLDAEERWKDKKDLSTEESLVKYDETFTYPSLAACTSGKKIPGLAEFMALPEADSDLWITVAARKNPHWFPIETKETEQDTEKKEPLPTD